MATSLLYFGSIVVGVVGSVAGLGWLARCVFGTARLPVPHRRTSEPPQPVHRPLELVAADLRRLARQLARVPAGAPMARRRGLQAAYDDVLLEAAELLEVPHTLTGTPPGLARDAERLRVQAALAAAGLVVQD
ncbi:hypothetical protein [Geodermatophilus sabuli]|uniref:Uncharacterized protein n=1 Tax=Geodermatophilus sabuli TaxID=1564158 RepID=A0A285ED84_9ACTN|nr:hypothetical protein [Geodermatophilus sabuli]MBB3083332.1 hypothetical protein [Geodermatophilus sabuli]SNX96947.1 hypothetical protein SAMN06893097_105288 [Geodermatophilus sabuli]